MKTKYIIREHKFIGYNDTDPPEQLPPGVLAIAKNCFCGTGEIVKRNGYSLIGNDVGSAGCQGIKGVEFANGTKEIIAIFNGIIYKWTGSGNLSAISGSYTLSTTSLIDIVVANNNVYFFDGSNTVPKYNGTTISTVAAIPTGSYARWFHNQLHVSGIIGDANALKSSTIGDPETFTGGTSSDIDVNPNDGDLITGLHELKDELVVFKRNRIWSATGFGTAALTLDDINERLTGFGGLSHFGIINTGNDLLYIGFLGMKPHIRSLKRTQFSTVIDGGVLSEGIETTMNGLNKAQLTKAAGIFDGRYAWFAMPNGSNTTNNIVLTLDTETIGRTRRGWTQHTGINASCFDSFAINTTPQIYFGEASADSKAYVFDTSTSDNGTAIAFQAKSRCYGGDKPEIKKKFKWLWMWAKEVGNYDITIDYAGDGFEFNNLGTLNLAGTGSVLDSLVLDSSRLGATDVKKERFTVPKSRHHYLQFDIYDNSAASAVTIRNWELTYQEKSPIDE